VTKTEQQQLRQEWENRIAQYQSSGQSVREWCAANGVKPGRLWYWLRRTKTGRTETESATWLPVEVVRPPLREQQASAGLLVRVGKASIEVRPGFDCDLFSAVVRVLSTVC